MRILVTHDSFDGFGGTETYMLAVAEQLQRTGHDVSLHGSVLGPMAEFARSRGIRVVDRVELPGACDLVLAQDAASCLEMAARYPAATRIFVAHSDVHALQCPPQLDGPTQAVVVLNDRMVRWAQSLSWAGRIIRLRQPIDLDRFRVAAARTSGPLRVLVLSNYAFGSRAAQIQSACRRLGAELSWVRSGSAKPELQIAAADAVIGLGRSALDAMAAARATLILGPLGGDGWVTPEKYAMLEADGFVGRATDRTLDGPALARELAAWEPHMGSANRDLVACNHDVRAHAAELIALARELGAPAASPSGVENELARLVRLEYQRSGAVDSARGENHTLQLEVQAERARSHELDARLAASEAHIAKLTAELERTLTQLDVLVASRRWRTATMLGKPRDQLRRRLPGRSARPGQSAPFPAASAAPTPLAGLPMAPAAEVASVAPLVQIEQQRV